jgi:predicted RNA-binding Zn-ribbon protein involved in translation (DUF1610 family)
MPQEEMCTLIFYGMDSDYPREVLGHGGVNVFPEREVTCWSCDLFIRTNTHRDSVLCPCCGEENHLRTGQTFSEWSHARSLRYQCDFIERAARADNRKPVVPLPDENVQ